jgi:hypothetical protein
LSGSASGAKELAGKGRMVEVGEERTSSYKRKRNILLIPVSNAITASLTEGRRLLHSECLPSSKSLFIDPTILTKAKRIRVGV